MPLVLAVNEDEQVSINGEMIITAKIKRGEVRICFDGPAEKYVIKRLKALTKKVSTGCLTCGRALPKNSTEKTCKNCSRVKCLHPDCRNTFLPNGDSKRVLCRDCLAKRFEGGRR